MHAACHAAWVAKGGHGGCIQQYGGQLRQYAPPPRPSESEIEVCSDGDGAHDDESAEEGAKDEREDREDGSYAGECTNDEAYDDEAKPAAKRKRKANKGSGRPAKRARAQTPNGNKCAHGRRRNLCKECGGASICAHGRQRSQCKECGGASICAHGRRRSTCKECGGAGICAHGRRRTECKECGGSSICAHGRRRSTCRECGATKGG